MMYMLAASYMTKQFILFVAINHIDRDKNYFKRLDIV